MKRLLPFLFLFGFIAAQAQQKRSITPIPNMVADANYRVGCSLFSDPLNYTTGSSFSYSAPVNNNSYLVGPGGANYGCLYSVPNQAWFVITVNTGGSLYFNFSNTYGYDVDAAIWGPIANNDIANACAATQSSPLTCDYDTGRPDLYINNAQAGQKYVMLVTNYSNANTTINITQPSGGSVTYAMVNLPNCSMIPTATISGTSTSISEGQSATLTLSFTGSSPWNYSLSDGTMGTSYTSPTNITVYPTSSQTYTINSVSNLCGTNSGSGSVGISVTRNISLKSCFPLDGNATDSKNLNNGTLQNGVLTATNRSSEANKALQFDGINDYVSLPTSQLNNNTFAFAAWVKLDELPTSLNTEKVAFTLGGTGDEHYLGVEYYNGAASWKFASNDSKVYSTAIVNTDWHLLIGVRTGGLLKLYVDGVLTGTSSTSGTATYGSPLSGRIGSSIANDKFFKGKIDDIKIFNGSLIDPEISLLQNYTSCSNVFTDPYLSVQSISTSLICTNSPFIVRGVTNNLTIESGTPFVVELSDASGSFSNPTIIGSSEFLPITATIPNTVTGGDYKIRLRYGALISVNSFDIYVNKVGTYNVTGSTTINDGQSANIALNFTGTGPWNYVLSTGLSGAATTSPWTIPVTLDQTTTYSVISAQNVCGTVTPDGNTSATVTVNFTKQNVTCLPFNGNANDEKGNNTTTINGPLLTENRYGQTNAAYSFNGTNNYIEYTTNLLRKREYTMSAWVLANNISGGTQYVLSQGETGTNTFQGLALTNSGWQFVSYTNGGAYYTSSYTGWTANQWVHLTAVRTYQQLKLYVNGNLVSNVYSADNIPFKVSDIGRIGANSSGLGNYFNGKIDDVRLYKGALNDEEVYALYANTGNCPTIENSSIILVKSISPTTVCAGSSINVTYTSSSITPTAGSPFKVQLSDQNGSFANPTVIGSGTSSPISAIVPNNVASSSLYKVRIVSSGGSPVTSITTAALTVSGALPTATISGGGNIPYGGTANLTVTFTGTSPWTYSINNGSSQSTSTSPVTIPVSPTSTTTYTVTSVSNSCGTGTGNSTTVTVAPNIILGSIASSFCFSQSFTIPFTANYTPFSVFQAELSDANGSFASPVIIGTSTSSPMSIIIPTNTVGGTAYKIRIVTTVPAYTSPEYTNLTIVSKPSASISGTATINYGQSTDLTIAFGGTGPWTYRINNGSSQTTSTNPLTVPVSPTSTTTYTVTSISNSCGNGTASGSAVVTVNPNIIPGSLGGSIFCQGQSFSVPFTANYTPSPNFKVELSDAAGSFASAVTMGTGTSSPISVTIPANTPGGAGYKMRIVTTSPAYTSPEFGNLTILIRPTATITGTTTIKKDKSTDLTITFTGSGPWTYAINNGTSQTTSTNPLTITVSPTTTTTYTVTSLSNSCSTGTTDGSAVVTVTNDPYLISCYLFDGNVNDGYGNNHGTMGAGASFTTDRFNNPDKALYLSATSSNSFVEIPLNELINNTAYTFSLWFTTQTSGSMMGVNLFTVMPAGSDTYSSAQALMLKNDDIDAQLSPLFYATVCSGAAQCFKPFGSINDLVPFNTWYHVAITRENDVVKLYRNGVLLNTYPVVGGYANVSNLKGYIGKELSNLGLGYNFRGKVDDLKIYRRALNDAQVEALYNQVGCGDITETPFVNIETVSNSNICQGGSLSIQYKSRAITTPIKAQLSDASGNFTNPIQIGSGNTSPISVQIPVNQIAGTGYRIRLVSSDIVPVISGISQAITIANTPTATIVGSRSINPGQSANITIGFTGSGPWTYAVNNGATQTSNVNSLTIPVSPTVTTTYNVTLVSNICGVGTTSGSAVITVTSDPYLISCYLFNGNVNDGVGNNHATATGVSYTTDRFNNPGSALLLSGNVNSYAEMPLDELGNISAYTFSVWFNSSQYTTQESIHIFSMMPAPDDNILNSYGKSQSVSLRNQYFTPEQTGTYFGTVCANNNQCYTAFGTVTDYISLNTWYQLTVTRENNVVKLYRNGALLNTITVVSDNSNLGNLKGFIGKDFWELGLGSAFKGKIDDIKIYKKALSASQVKALYRQASCDDIVTTPFVNLESVSSTSICRGQTVSVQYVAQKITTLIKVELSDANGSFASPVIIGSGNTSPISAQIPADQAIGNGYKMRLVSSDATPYSSNFSPTLSVTGTSVATISGTTTITEDKSTNLTLTFTGAGPWTYKINNGTNQTATVSPTTISVSPTSNTTYTITSVSNTCGVGTASGGADVTVTHEAYLVSCYPFSGNSNDNKGTNNGTKYGGVALTTDRFNTANSAYLFDGFDDYIQMPTNGFGNMSAYSVSLWISTTAYAHPNGENLFTVLPSGYDSGPMHSLLFTNLDVNVEQTQALYRIPCENFTCQYFLPQTFTPNTWYNIVITRQGDILRIYSNGTLVVNISRTGINFDPTMDTLVAYLGKQFKNDGEGGYFRGKIDDVQIYKRALTAGQVQALYNNSNACFDAGKYTCLADAVYNSLLSGQQVLQVKNQIIGSGTIKTGANINFDAKNSVILQPGFKTEDNTTFTAKAGAGCVD